MFDWNLTMTFISPNQFAIVTVIVVKSLEVHYAACCHSTVTMLPVESSELSDFRLRTEGLNTVSKLLHESRAENKLLKDRNAQLERSLDSVNVKLQKAGK